MGAKRWVFRTGQRRVTVYAETEDAAELKASEALDERMAARAGIEPPVAHTWFSIQKGNRKTVYFKYVTR